MKKLTIHFLILWVLALAVTALFAIVLPFEHTDVYWVACGCILAMFILVAITAWRAFRRGTDVFSKALGWPIFKAGWAALIVQIAVGFILMAVAGILPVIWAVVIEAVVFACALAVLVMRDAAREAVTDSEQRALDSTAAWKALRLRISAVAAETGNEQVKKLAEEIRYSDPTPTELDGRLAEMVETLSSYATRENIEKAAQLLRQRNELAKAMKKA